MALNADTLGGQITGVHAMLATAAKNPLLAISPDEGKALAVAVIEVGKQYSVSIDPKTLAWINLIGAACAVYGPKIFYVVMTKQQQKAPPAAPGEQVAAAPIVQNVVPLKFE